MTRTVMVLGAGASWPYGFPTGPTLVSDIERLCRKAGEPTSTGLPPTVDTFRQVALRQMQVKNLPSSDARQLHHFAALIDGQMPSSIDWFLGQPFAPRFEHFKDIGLLAIAWEIGLSESIKSQNSPVPAYDSADGETRAREHWYRTFWQSLGIRQISDLEQLIRTDALRVVTFNYDRSFDLFMFRRAMALYEARGEGLADVRAQALLKEFDICHVYGSLGSLEELPYGGLAKLVKERSEYFEMAPVLQACQKRLMVIEDHRQGQEEAAFGKARQWIEASDRLVFLGFGFDKENVKRLGFPEVGKRWHQVFATTFGMGPPQRQEALSSICKDLAQARLGGATLHILDDHHALSNGGYLHRYQPFANLGRR